MMGHLQHERLEPDLVTCNAAITAVERRYDKATEIFDQAMLRSLQPNEITCNALLTSCAIGHSWQAALKLYAWMLSSALETNIISFDMALSSCCAGGQLKLALNVLDSVQQQYSTLLRSWEW